MSKLSARFMDKYGTPIYNNRSSNPLSKKAFSLYGSVYEYPNAGRYRPRMYTSQDTELGVNQYSRDLLLRWSREMVSQQPWIDAGVRTLSLFAVGCEYNPIYTGDNSEWGNQAISWLKEQFYPNCCSRGPNYDFQTVVTLLSEKMDVDGDILILFGEKNGQPMFQLVPAHRIRSYGSSPFDPVTNDGPIPGPTPNTVVSDGVVYNMEGYPIGYSVQNRDNMVNSSFSNSNGDNTYVSSKNARLIYVPRFPDRGRGIPTISSGILQAMSVEEIESYLVEKLKIQSMYAAIEHLPEGEGPYEEEQAYQRAASSINANLLQGFNVGTQPQDNASQGLRVVNSPSIKYVSAAPGVDIKFPAASITEKETSEFITRLETHVLSTLGVPHALLFSQDNISGKMNSSVVDMFNSSITKRQQLLDIHSKFIVGWALAKAVKNKELPPNDEEILTNCFSFTHPKKFTLEDNKNRQSDLNEFEAGTMSLTEVASKRNTTAEIIMDDIEKETTSFLNRAQRIAKATNMDISIVLQTMRADLKQKTTPFGGGDDTPTPVK